MMAQFLLSAVSVTLALYVLSGRGVLADFNITRTFSCEDDPNFLCQGSAQTSLKGLLKLAGPTHAGTALYKDPVKLQNTSLSVTFSFQLPKQRPDFLHDGIVFVMLVDPNWQGVDGPGMGTYNEDGFMGTQGLAVEFDVWSNRRFYDPDNNHVGINLNGAQSVVARSLDDISLHLPSDLQLFVWVDYDALASNLEIRIHNNSSKPTNDFIRHTVNLHEVLGDSAYVGFTAANGYSNYTVFDMSLRNFSIDQNNTRASTVNASDEKGPSVECDKVLAILLGVSTIVLLTCLTLSLVVIYKCKLKARKDQESDQPLVRLRKFSYRELSGATNQFSDDCKLGEGGCGTVYRGTISSSGQLIAVKKWTNVSNHGGKEFTAELSIISQLRHRSIVLLVGWCETNENLLLVYEYIPNGSLHNALFGSGHRAADTATCLVLTWKRRFKVICEVAAALQYLHNGWRQRVIHRDVKSSNIILDKNFNAILGDFGLARVADHKNSLATTQVAGTFGYMAPELLDGKKFSDKSDIYAFGVLVLEIVCGRMVFDPDPAMAEVMLVEWVQKKIEKSHLDVVDSRLGSNFDDQELEEVLKLGLLCCHEDPHERPTSIQIYSILVKLGGECFLETKTLEHVPQEPDP